MKILEPLWDRLLIKQKNGLKITKMNQKACGITENWLNL